MQTFINLPPNIAESVSRILMRSDSRVLSNSAKELHERYMQGLNPLEPAIQKSTDCIAYLGLRFPATYAQIVSALSHLAERLPAWKPKSVLELGCGPGTGIWAAKSVWPAIVSRPKRCARPNGTPRGPAKKNVCTFRRCTHGSLNGILRSSGCSTRNSHPAFRMTNVFITGSELCIAQTSGCPRPTFSSRPPSVSTRILHLP